MQWQLIDVGNSAITGQYCSGENHNGKCVVKVCTLCVLSSYSRLVIFIVNK